MNKSPPYCTKCNKNHSIYYRPYSGERLCAGCFKKSIMGKVERTISKFRMFEHDSRITVGVSGGKDSLGLLHLLSDIESKFPKSELIAISIDEGVSGYRDEALAIANEACRNLKVEQVVHSFKNLFGLSVDEIANSRRDLTPCSYCGVLRRRAMNKAAKELNADVMATGHNLDDMAQTAILNILRGDIKRLYLMNPGGNHVPGFVRRVKPLCEVPEHESTLFAYLKGFKFQEISCPYSSEAMRTDIRAFLNRMEVKRPGTKFIAFKTALNLIPKEREIEIAGNCIRCGEPTTNNICRVCKIIEELE